MATRWNVWSYTCPSTGRWERGRGVLQKKTWLSHKIRIYMADRRLMLMLSYWSWHIIKYSCCILRKHIDFKEKGVMYEPSIKWFRKPFEHVYEPTCVITQRDHTSQNEWLSGSSNTSSGLKVLLRGLNYSISLNSSETPNKMSTWELNVERGCIFHSWYLHFQTALSSWSSQVKVSLGDLCLAH